MTQHTGMKGFQEQEHTEVQSLDWFYVVLTNKWNKGDVISSSQGVNERGLAYRIDFYCFQRNPS